MRSNFGKHLFKHHSSNTTSIARSSQKLVYFLMRSITPSFPIQQDRFVPAVYDKNVCCADDVILLTNASICAKNRNIEGSWMKDEGNGDGSTKKIGLCEIRASA